MAAIIGGVRFRKIDPAFYPFIYCIWIAFANELISFYLTKTKHSTAINNNIYVLLESVLISWQFKKWGYLQKPSYLSAIIISCLAALWVIDAFFVYSIKQTISYYRIIYSCFIIVVSVTVINKELAFAMGAVTKSPVFILCVAFTIYFTFKIVTGLFWLYGLGSNMKFLLSLVAIINVVNCITNLIYALAVLWMPTKQRFSLPY